MAQRRALKAGEAPADGPEPAPRPLAPLRVITAHYYLEDTYPELGPTFFIAGSHLAGRPPRDSDQSAYNGMPDQSLLVKAGDCVLFRSDVCKARTLRPCAPSFLLFEPPPAASSPRLHDLRVHEPSVLARPSCRLMSP